MFHVKHPKITGKVPEGTFPYGGDAFRGTTAFYPSLMPFNPPPVLLRYPGLWA